MNYRTTKELKSYKGCIIERTHANGNYYYNAYQEDLYGNKTRKCPTQSSLKSLHKEIDKIKKREKELTNYLSGMLFGGN